MSILPDAITPKSSLEHHGLHAEPESVDTTEFVSQIVTVAWQRELATAIRTSADLLERLGLTSAFSTKTGFRDGVLPEFSAALDAEKSFPVFVPESFLRRMERGNWNDPLLRQVLALNDETQSVPGFQSDAVGDLAARRSPGLLHKYHGRALLIAAGSCAIHCRYCFRRDYPYGDDPKQLPDWEPAFQQLSEDSSIREVILSGGDPLMLSDDRLTVLCHRIDRIPHVQRLRIHTRMPVVLPSRMTDALLAMLTVLRVQVIFVVHANHGNEVVADCSRTLQDLVRRGFPVLNQAVLLRGINDSVESLEDLSLRLVDLGVMPYYLHQLDRVTGTAHFEVAEETGRELIQQLAARLPGYAVPRYVREIPGASGKTPL